MERAQQGPGAAAGEAIAAPVGLRIALGAWLFGLGALFMAASIWIMSRDRSFGVTVLSAPVMGAGAVAGVAGVLCVSKRVFPWALTTVVAVLASFAFFVFGAALPWSSHSSNHEFVRQACLVGWGVHTVAALVLLFLAASRLR